LIAVYPTLQINSLDSIIIVIKEFLTKINSTDKFCTSAFPAAPIGSFPPSSFGGYFSGYFDYFFVFFGPSEPEIQHCQQPPDAVVATTTTTTPLTTSDSRQKLLGSE
jgi:hypothetical protein